MRISGWCCIGGGWCCVGGGWCCVSLHWCCILLHWLDILLDWLLHHLLHLLHHLLHRLLHLLHDSPWNLGGNHLCGGLRNHHCGLLRNHPGHLDLHLLHLCCWHLDQGCLGNHPLHLLGHTLHHSLGHHGDDFFVDEVVLNACNLLLDCLGHGPHLGTRHLGLHCLVGWSHDGLFLCCHDCPRLLHHLRLHCLGHGLAPLWHHDCPLLWHHLSFHDSLCNLLNLHLWLRLHVLHLWLHVGLLHLRLHVLHLWLHVGLLHLWLHVLLHLWLNVLLHWGSVGCRWYSVRLHWLGVGRWCAVAAQWTSGWETTNWEGH